MATYSILNDYVLSVLSYEEADNSGFNLSLQPLLHRSEDLKLQFLEANDDGVGPMNLYFKENRIVLVCGTPMIYDEDFKKMIETSTTIEEFKKYFLVYVSEVNFEALSVLEENIVSMSEAISSGENIEFQLINQLKSTCLEFSKNARRNVFSTETTSELKNEQLHFLTESIYQYSQHLLDLTQHLIDTHNSMAQKKNNAILSRLTLVTLFTTPFTLLAGLYGMNFGYLPWATHPYGHLILLGIMSMSSFSIYVLLKYKKIL